MPSAAKTIPGSTVGEGFAVTVAVVGTVALADGAADPTAVGTDAMGAGELGPGLVQPETAMTREATATTWSPVRRLIAGSSSCLPLSSVDRLRVRVVATSAVDPTMTAERIVETPTSRRCDVPTMRRPSAAGHDGSVRRHQRRRCRPSSRPRWARPLLVGDAVTNVVSRGSLVGSAQ